MNDLFYQRLPLGLGEPPPEGLQSGTDLQFFVRSH